VVFGNGKLPGKDILKVNFTPSDGGDGDDPETGGDQ